MKSGNSQQIELFKLRKPRQEAQIPSPAKMNRESAQARQWQDQSKISSVIYAGSNA